MIYLTLFYEFFKIGLFAVGGGLATLPFLTDMCGRYAWFTEQMLTDMIAISEATPGPIGVNMATYAGYNAAGWLGAAVATSALTLPSLLIILMIARFLTKFNEHPLVKSAFNGLRPAATGLITAAMLGVMRIALFHGEAASFLALFNWPALALFAVLTAGILLWKKGHPLIFIAAAALAGIILKL